MKKYFSYLFFLFLLAAPSAVYACSCAPSTPSMAFNDSKAVFIGKMTGGTEKHIETDADGATYAIESGKVIFEVVESFKGTPGKTVTLQINSMKGTSCGTYGLRRGETYVVYAYESQPGTLSTGVCSRTATVSQAKEDIDFLRSPGAGSGGKLEGKIWIDTQAATGGGTKAFPGVEVRVTGPGQTVYTAVTDRKGEFTLTRLPPGAYRIEATAPANYYFEDETNLVTISDRGTAATGFEAKYDGHVRGRVTDARGIAFEQTSLMLMNAKSMIFVDSGHANGLFSADGVPPGLYYLAADLGGPGPSRYYYYPGTYSKARAKTIRVGPGRTVKGIKFILPKEFWKAR
jgi:hypothetical protein